MARRGTPRWIRTKTLELVMAKQGAKTPPKPIRDHQGDRLELGVEAMNRAIESGRGVVAATWIPQLPDWIDFYWGDERIGLKHLFQHRKALYEAYGQLWPNKPNPLPTGKETLLKLPQVLGHCTSLIESGGKQIAIWEGWWVILEATTPRCVISAYDKNPDAHRAYLDVIAIRPELAY